MSRSLYGRLYRTYGTPPSHSDRLRFTAEKIQELEQAASFELEELGDVQRRASNIDVAIIGAGFAGLAAGWWLSKHGFRVTIYEAASDIGGRVLTNVDKVSQRMIEAGGELIGRNHPRWLWFAREFGLGLSVLTSEDQYGYASLKTPLVIGGCTLTRAQQETVFQEMTDALVTLNADASQVSAYHPWTAKPAAKWDQETVGQWLAKVPAMIPKCSQDTLDALRFELENNQAVPIDDQSYLGLLAEVRGGALTPLGAPNRGPSEYWTESEVFRCASGNQQLARELLAQIRKRGGSVSFNTPVNTLTVAPAGVQVNGTHQVAWAILAAPPSVWNKITVTGAQLSKMQMGSAIKYLCDVDGRFWLHKGLAPSATADGLGMIWEGTDNQNLPQGSGAEMSLFAGGPAAQTALQSQNVNRYLQAGLDSIYPGFKSALVADQLRNWPSEPWIGAGYSCPAKGQVMTVAQHLYDPPGRLLFAGEHTCMAFFGYMEGALESGLHAALLIAQREKVPQAVAAWQKKQTAI